MQKFFISVLAALLIGGIASAQSFPDIPAGHWAGDAVEEIADLGIVIGFPDGTFRGNEAFTRYQSALVVSRLLAVVDANMEAELGGLRAALQELAADVAAQGVRLAAAESAIAGLSDNVAANSARLDALEAMDFGGVDEAVLRDLQNQIASQRVAVDTAQAQAEAAEARANGAYDLALQALAAADANASDIAALNQALQLLSQRVDGLGTGGATAAVDLSGLEAGIATNAGDIANIREFVILLRRDQVALRDRVSALEAADAEIAASVADLEARVTALETNPLGFSGQINLSYFVGRTLGAYDFDVDRVYGANADRSMGNSAFSTGTRDGTDSGTVAGNSVGERAQDIADITQTTGSVSPTITLNINSYPALDGTGSPRALNGFTAVVNVGLTRISDAGEAALGLPASVEGAWIFTVRDWTTTFSPIGASPLTFAFGEKVSTSFTRYVFDIDETNGYVATVGAPDFLAFLNPGLTAAYFSDEAGGYMRGVRGTMAPEFGDAIRLSGGVSFAQYATMADDKDDVLADNVVDTVWGLDGTANLIGLVNLEFEYASSTPGSILYVNATVDGSNLPILNRLGANYRAMAIGFDGIDATGNSTPFELGQSGFGVEAGLGLFILDVTGFFDSYTEEVSGDANVGFGASVSANLFAGFSLTGFYESASTNGATVDTTVNDRDVRAGYSLLDGDYDSKFGVGIRHDGAADNALIRGLNIAAGYERWEADYSRTVIYANADYALDVSIVSLTPYVAYRSDVDADAGTNDYSEIRAGIGLRTQALDIILKPSLQAAANYRSTTWSDASAFTATELQWSVGLNLEEFLLPYSSLSARVGSWTGTNTTLATNSGGVTDDATDISAGRGGDTNSGLSENVFGYEVTWNYYDLRFAYGNYTSDRGGNLASAQAFSIRYTVDF